MSLPESLPEHHPEFAVVTVDEARIDLVHQLHEAMFGATWARPESPADVWRLLLRMVYEQRSAIDAITELLVGQPIWAQVPEAWHCKDDRETHGEWTCEFLTDLQRILHPLRPEMVSAP